MSRIPSKARASAIKEAESLAARTNGSQSRDPRGITFNSFVKQQQAKRIVLIPKSDKQAEYIDLLSDWNKLLVFAIGPAGTGKSFLCVQAGIKALKNKEVEKIVITRPAVGVENESHGFLPGTINEKMAPWTQPIMDVFAEHYSQRDITAMLEDKIIELAPLAYQRGRTFKDSWIIVDEAQNLTINQMLAITTRPGDGSKMIITGDLNQKDKKFTHENGLSDILDKLRMYYTNMISVVEFTRDDVQRSALVKEILELYGQV